MTSHIVTLALALVSNMYIQYVEATPNLALQPAHANRRASSCRTHGPTRCPDLPSSHLVSMPPMMIMMLLTYRDWQCCNHQYLAARTAAAMDSLMPGTTSREARREADGWSALPPTGGRGRDHLIVHVHASERGGSEEQFRLAYCTCIGRYCSTISRVAIL